MNPFSTIEYVLDSHMHVAWDFDGTLVNGAYSDFLCSYIRSRPEKKHSIVTFRNSTMASNVWSELSHTDLKSDDFENLINAPDDVTLDCEYILDDGRIVLQHHWKGMVAKDIGATLLVDDIQSFCLPGCKKYKIDFLNSTNMQLNLAL